MEVIIIDKRTSIFEFEIKFLNFKLPKIRITEFFKNQKTLKNILKLFFLI